MYQNNNNRLMPKAIEDRNLKPAATVTDKLIRYTPDTSSATQWANTANTLASLGKGLMDMDTLLHYQSQENALRAVWETEQQGGNKKDWQEVSKRIKGAGVFNPYNDDAFRQLQAQDIYREATLELLAKPNLEKLGEKAFNQLVSDATKKMKEGFTQTGLSPKDYGTTIMQWNEQIKTLTQKYIIANKEYKYDQLKIKESSNLTTKLNTALMEAKAGTETAVFRQVIEETLQHLVTETGIVASDEQAKLILDGVKNFIAKGTSQMDDAEILAAITDLKLSDGTPLNEVSPNYEVMIKDLLVEARETNYKQLKLEVEAKSYQQEQMVKEIVTDFSQKITKGELSSPDSIQAYAEEVMKTYDIDGIHCLQLFQYLGNGRKLWSDLAEVETDPRVAANLSIGVIMGTATYEDITEAINNGSLNYKEGFQMLQNLQTREQKQQNVEDKRVKTHIDNALKEFIYGDKKGEADILPVITNETYQALFKQRLSELYAQYEQDHDYQKFNDNLAEFKTASTLYVKEKEKQTLTTGILKGYEDIARATPQISQAQWAKRDFNKSTQAIRQMGLTHGVFNRKDTSVSILSMPTPNRKITVTDEKGRTYTKNSPHKGYDLQGSNIKMSVSVYPPMKGTVVAVIPEKISGGMGNAVLVKCSNGKYIKYMHLQERGLPKVGQEVDTNTAIGRIGNTGAVANKKVGSLHVEFYDENKAWITAYQFLEKNKKK